MDRILLRIGIKNDGSEGQQILHISQIIKLVSLLALNFFTSHSHPHGNFISYNFQKNELRHEKFN